MTATRHVKILGRRTGSSRILPQGYSTSDGMPTVDSLGILSISGAMVDRLQHSNRAISQAIGATQGVLRGWDGRPSPSMGSLECLFITSSTLYYIDTYSIHLV